jgi:hypothetical protein
MESQWHLLPVQGHSGTCNLQRVPRPPVSLGQGVELVGILPNDMDTQPDLFLHNLNFNYQQTISPPPTLS